MDVLVYSGPGVSQTSLSHSLLTLRRLLVPHYTVNTVTPSQLATQPWTTTCALLVIPGGRDVPYHEALKGQPNARIKEFVKKGGRYLGIGAGAYYASKRVEWEAGNPAAAVIGDRELGFFPGTCQGNVYEGFIMDREEGGRAVAIELDLDEEGEGKTLYRGIYYNGGGHFVAADEPSIMLKGVRVVGRYADQEGKDKVATVLCKVGEGKAALWGAHLEYPLTEQPAAGALDANTRGQCEELERGRLQLMERTLQLLNLAISGSSKSPQIIRTGPLPQILVGSRSSIVKKLLHGLEPEFKPNTLTKVLEDANDTLVFHPPDSLHSLMESKRQQPSSVSDPKDIVYLDDTETYPSQTDTPKFSLERYFTHLARVRKEMQIESKEIWGMGEALLYGEVVTSTQTMFDRNPTFMGALQNPVLSLASQQLTGRGRGSNVWLSPEGCLQFSLLLRPPVGFPNTAIVFIQYLFGLAVVEACRKVLSPEAGKKVRLKWPNDIYAVVGEEKKKLGGILVNTNWSGGNVDIIIGCGINVLNPLPTTSLSHLPGTGSTSEPPSMEDLAAMIMAVFEKMWDKFNVAKGSFAPFMELYLERWLHSDQLVLLTTTTPHTRVRIVGITSDHGMLRTLPERDFRGGATTEQFIDLQPDGNSFDMMEGLIKVKN